MPECGTEVRADSKYSSRCDVEFDVPWDDDVSGQWGFIGASLGEHRETVAGLLAWLGWGLLGAETVGFAILVLLALVSGSTPDSDATLAGWGFGALTGHLVLRPLYHRIRG